MEERKDGEEEGRKERGEREGSREEADSMPLCITCLSHPHGTSVRPASPLLFKDRETGSNQSHRE